MLQTLVHAINRLDLETFFGNPTPEQIQSIGTRLLELRKRKARAAGA